MVDPETVSPPGKTEAADGFPLCVSVLLCVLCGNDLQLNHARK